MKERLLEIKNLDLCISKPNGAIALLKNVNFNLSSRDCVVLVGESGVGKTSLALHLLQLQNKKNFLVTNGDILWKGKSLLAMNDKQLNYYRKKEVKIIFQDSLSSLHPQKKIGFQILEAFSISLNLAKKKLIIKKFLQKVALLPQFYDYYPHQLSGGQRQRILLVIALINKPKILIADEPTTALDSQTLQIILKVLGDYQAKHNVGILFITHRLSLFSQMKPKFYEIKDCYLREYFVPPKNQNNAFFKTNTSNKKPAILLQTKNLSVDYPIGFWKKKNVIKDCNLTLAKGQILGVMGISGSGKTTLIRALLQLLPHTGKIFWKGKETNSFQKSDWRDYRRNIAPVFQDPDASLSPKISIEKIICEGVNKYQNNLGKIAKQNKILNILEKFSLPLELLQSYSYQLSAGQKQRLALARIYLYAPQLLLLDEPTSFLDDNNQKKIIEHLLDYQRKTEASYLIVSHDKNLLESVADNILFLNTK